MRPHKTKRILIIFISLFVLSFLVAGQSFAADYLVQRGDTLWAIANKYGITVQELMRANGLNSDLILVGQTLTVPEGAETPDVVEKKPAPAPEKKPAPAPEKRPEPEMKPKTPPEKPASVTEDRPSVPGAIEFKWAFVARKDPSGRNKVINIAEIVSNPGSDKPIIAAGDKISFFVEPGENTYIYIYLVDSRNNLELIFPTSMDKNVLNSEFTTGKRNYIPGKYEWLSFDDNTGTETFYLLASSSRLNKLEDLTRDYINAEGDQGTTKKMILNEIKGQKRLVAFMNPVEQPISFGGRIRGLEIDIAKLAVEVRGKDIYSKTIRLRHE